MVEAAEEDMNSERDTHTHTHSLSLSSADVNNRLMSSGENINIM